MPWALGCLGTEEDIKMQTRRVVVFGGIFCGFRGFDSKYLVGEACQ